MNGFSTDNSLFVKQTETISLSTPLVLSRSGLQTPELSKVECLPLPLPSQHFEDTPLYGVSHSQQGRAQGGQQLDIDRFAINGQVICIIGTIEL